MTLRKDGRARRERPVFSTTPQTARIIDPMMDGPAKVVPWLGLRMRVNGV
jgi:hypothetical protein